jgi:thymidylate synthase
MYIAHDTLDDLLRAVFRKLLHTALRIRSTKGSNTELSGVLLEIRNPRARLSRTETKGTVFSCLGETLWYLAGNDRLDFIGWYVPAYRQFSDDKRTLFGAYGPRLRLMRGKVDQLKNVINLLKKRPQTRQAVIQLFNAEDLLKPHKDIPCTCTIQFLIRRNHLHVIANMRSNDAFLGLPHDVFAFTFLQEVVARSVGVKLGTYKHHVGSLHLYNKNRDQAKSFLKEGWQSTISMPPMPPGDPWSNIRKLLLAEAKIRSGKDVNISKASLPRYWEDLARLVEIFANTGRKSIINNIKRDMSSNVYDAYIDRRAAMAIPRRLRSA